MNIATMNIATKELDKHYDLVIMGGGLAGLTLALQVRQRNPDLSILVLERRPQAAPEAAHKVGESTVELGMYYLSDVLSLRDYLEEVHLQKQGLRYFFTPQHELELANRVEFGAKNNLPIHSYQLDRGRLENDLVQHISALRVTTLLGASVKKVNIVDDGLHQVSFVEKGKLQSVSGRWVVDATGRGSLLKRHLGFEKSLDHNINAVWFRLRGEVDVDDWSEQTSWKEKVKPGFRRLATVHLMGQGYWVWLIPLGTGSTSVGIVADPRYHDINTYNSFEKALEWMADHEPIAAKQLALRHDDLMDFRMLKHYAHDCGRFFSHKRWGVTGDAGAFLDPLYSPGTDFIAFSNTFLTDLILRDHSQEQIDERVFLYEQTYIELFQRWLTLYQDKYTLFGNTQITVAKILWDTANYWAVPVPMFCNGVYTNQDLIQVLFATPDCIGKKFSRLNEQVQAFFLGWYELDNGDSYSLQRMFIEPLSLTYLYNLHVEMEHQYSEPVLIEKLAENLRILEEIAAALFALVFNRFKGTPIDMPIDPYTMSIAQSKQELLAAANGQGSFVARDVIAKEVGQMWFYTVADAGHKKQDSHSQTNDQPHVNSYEAESV